MISGKKKDDYFSRWGWTGVIGLKRKEKLVFGRTRFCAGLRPVMCMHRHRSKNDGFRIGAIGGAVHSVVGGLFRR
jgi:hypothetical protein